MKKITQIFRVVTMIGMIIFPIIVLLIPVDYVEANPIPCVFRTFFNIECIGCGMTRASLNLLHFNFAKAYEYNRLVFIVLPLVISLYTIQFLKLIKKISFNMSKYTNKRL